MKHLLVLGYIVRGPLGGLVYHHLQYVLGLKRLGYRVLFLEDSEDYPACYDPRRHQLTQDPTYGLSFIRKVFRAYDLQHDWAYYDHHRGRWHGKSAVEVRDFCAAAELLLNLSGSNPLRSWTAEVPLRIYVDTDPVFTQIHNLQKPDARARTAAHTHHFSFGENAGRPGCLIPADGFGWRPTRQPVVPEIWPQIPARAGAPLTTVMQWDSYAELTFQGRQYGMKSVSFRDYRDLPGQVSPTLCLALGSATAPRGQLEKYGWQIRDAQATTVTHRSYQDFIAASRAEWSVAKHGYVAARSGWFSERSCAYLACGRPVVVQDTGFAGLYGNTGAILPFSTVEQAAEAIGRLTLDYDHHAARCREVIADLFDYRKVLGGLLEEVFHGR